MANILVLNGPNLNLLGSREPGQYGHRTLEEIMEDLERFAGACGHDLQHVQENSEGAAVLVGGDMNLHTAPGHRAFDVDGPVWTGFLEATGLSDVCDQLECTFGGEDDSGRIDKWAVRSSATVVLEPLERTVPQDDFVRDDGADLSDHLPVALRLAITAVAA